MIKFRLADGTYKNVKPEHLDIFKERYPDAMEIGGMDIPTPITQEGLTGPPKTINPETGREYTFMERAGNIFEPNNSF